MIHEIPLERRTLHGQFSRDLAQILAVDPGDSVAFACPNAGWRLSADETFDLRHEGSRDVVPLVDDVCLVALDLWAHDHGFVRGSPSLAGV